MNIDRASRRAAAGLACALCAAAAVRAQDSAANRTVTLVRGIRVGHYTLAARPTGCTVILADGGAIAGVAQRGAAPGTRETDLLRPARANERVDGIVLSGGSAYGLDTAVGVMRWLDEQGGDHVPIVPAAVLIDLWVGNRPAVRPGADCGYRAAAAASTAPVQEGTVGAGAGATVGKLSGRDRAMKAGIGSAAIVMPNGLQVAALVAVNALGDVVDPADGHIVAGVRNADGSLADARKLLRSGAVVDRSRAGENTTLAVVVTNATLTKAEASRVAQLADAGYARAINPIHTLADGDTIFTLATGSWSAGSLGRGAHADVVAAIGALAADAIADAVVRAATQATAAAGIPAARDLAK